MTAGDTKDYSINSNTTDSLVGHESLRAVSADVVSRAVDAHSQAVTGLSISALQESELTVKAVVTGSESMPVALIQHAQANGCSFILQTELETGHVSFICVLSDRQNMTAIVFSQNDQKLVYMELPVNNFSAKNKLYWERIGVRSGFYTQDDVPVNADAISPFDKTKVLIEKHQLGLVGPDELWHALGQTIEEFAKS